MGKEAYMGLLFNILAITTTTMVAVTNVSALVTRSCAMASAIVSLTKRFFHVKDLCLTSLGNTYFPHYPEYVFYTKYDVMG